MDFNQLPPELSLAKLAAQQAGDILMDYLERGFTIREKGESDLVSEADVSAEQAILKLIRDTFPTHEILAEESQTELLGDSVPEHLWIVDPLDGTTNFAHGIPHFAVSIAYLHHGKAQCGVVYNPARQDWYLAALGEGAWWNGSRLAVGEQTSLSNCLIGLGFYYDRGAMMEATLATIHKLFKTGIHGVRRFGTASLDLAQVARGFYGAFFEYQLSPWDFAAGRLLVEEAGGRCTTATGSELPFKKTSVLASNGHLHDTMLQIIDETAGQLFRK
ncbi:inositol monophosphatase family protein [Planctomicrobium piriforme]|uniref:Inositol-1-monophosphatase n=1 Tax=Planctomicrobium piriforme TaxID=1576369 RepID=A0A1I3P644_9PLAN|nr:inositol monophosphatase family protein [Planctomicrobium piriforme]SFJ16871.1 myo-inositol-1(or 4)-monophosphatase [Planctomicrobium piriforme]